MLLAHEKPGTEDSAWLCWKSGELPHQEDVIVNGFGDAHNCAQHFLLLALHLNRICSRITAISSNWNPYTFRSAFFSESLHFDIMQRMCSGCSQICFASLSQSWSRCGVPNVGTFNLRPCDEVQWLQPGMPWSLSVNLQPQQSEEERKGAMRGRQGVGHRQIACSLPKGTAAALFP